ncbi:MAG: sugar ABC transporter ATP-binding protein [Bifidobacteriaceae bacterium]|jgi:ribose transport system ATP-binding protein|nr:sugar ABC transporter ATP-binding protein [Bifidobacteriaceae bacterium]
MTVTSPDSPAPPLLEASGIVKIYPGVRALDGVGLTVLPGEVHGLAGENGAGKSTLVRILGGLTSSDSGVMRLGGELFEPRSPQESLKAGVRIVHQELNSLPNMTVGENLFLDQLPRRFGLVDRSAIVRRTTAVLKEVGLDLSPSKRMGSLSVAQIQLVEIARALTKDARLIVLDEPTASLTPPERARLLTVVRQLSQKGVAVIYISHHLGEILEICDQVTVLRNGRLIATKPARDLASRDLVRMMVGRELAEDQQFPSGATPGPVLLDVQRLAVTGLPGPVSFQVRQGEILGVAGLVGAGRSETMRALFGADRAGGGQIEVAGRRVRIRSPHDAVAAGISFATEDRKNQGLILPMSCAANISLAAMRRVSRFGWLAKARELAQTTQVGARMRVKAPSMKTIVGTLSGGNQQKVVLARWLFRDSSILIVDEPTRGIDVGARREIYGLLADLATAGKGVIVVSSDLEELTGLCHRIVVFSKGEIVADLDRADFNRETILNFAYRNLVS